MRKIPLYLILLTTALGAGIFISFIALRSISTPSTRTSSLPGFESDPNATPRPISTPRPSPLSQTSPKPSATPSRAPSPNQILYDVPFTPQAPFGEWENPKLSNGCEEASAFMAMSWVKGTGITPEQAKREIIAISNYEEANYGVYVDTSAQDTVNRIFKGFYGYQNVELAYDISVEDIKNQIRNGHLVIVPADGRELGNPYFTQPGPPRHMLVIIGYDPDNKQFITNDPGTRLGKQYRYSESVLFNAIRDYPTGNDLSPTFKRTAMIIVKK